MFLWLNMANYPYLSFLSGALVDPGQMLLSAAKNDRAYMLSPSNTETSGKRAY